MPFFFGETLPENTWKNVKNQVVESDLLITIGTSLQVSPVSSLPSMALESGSRLIIANLGKTPFDEYADLVIYENIGSFFQKINDHYNEILLKKLN